MQDISFLRNELYSLFEIQAVLVGPPITSLIRAHATCTRALLFLSFSLCSFSLSPSLFQSRSRFLGYARLWRIPGATELLFRGELTGALLWSRAQKFAPSLLAQQLGADVTETRLA